jgi:uncharacterized protein (DUF1800 family)
MMPRTVSLVAVALLAAASAAYGLSYDDAVHFLDRTGFGAPPRTVDALADATRDQAVAQAISSIQTDPPVAPPDWAQPPYPKPPGDKDHPPTPADSKAYQQLLQDHRVGLRSWYITGIISTQSPLTEKMDLFWHNHFTSSIDKVGYGELLMQQDLLIRRLGTGKFGDLLHAIWRDPAMVVYLDGASNVKGKPNENFARELLELFTLGEGNYTEQDIKEAARAFTGLTVDRIAGTVTFVPRRHDDGQKTFMGITGAFAGDDIMDIILQQDRTSVFLTEKLWRYFISPDPDPALVQSWAASFKASGYDIKTLLHFILSSDAFWADGNRDSLVKSPVELLAGFARTWEVKDYDPQRLAGQLARLGQDLFNPISVKGWPSGQDWIDASSLLERRRDIADLLNSVRQQSQLAQANLE